MTTTFRLHPESSHTVPPAVMEKANIIFKQWAFSPAYPAYTTRGKIKKSHFAAQWHYGHFYLSIGQSPLKMKTYEFVISPAMEGSHWLSKKQALAETLKIIHQEYCPIAHEAD